MQIGNVDVQPGQDTHDDENVDVPLSFEGVLRQLQRRTAAEIVQLMTENAELRAGLEATRAELGTYKNRATALEGVLAELTGGKS